jgi:4-diphosphocytidyl-2-C-methyl-D-erythritol kinase
MILIEEAAPAKINLVLQVGRARAGGLHEVCSLFASVELADSVAVEPAPAAPDEVICPGVEDPNLAAAAIEAFREAVPSLPPLRVAIEKRVPVAAGLGGGSADAAAVLRAANRIAGEPFDADGLRAIGARLGSDVPSQVEPRHAIVTGTGELVEPVELPPLPVVLVPSEHGLATGPVFAEADRIGGVRDAVDPDGIRALLGRDAQGLAAGLANDLERAALSLRPELEETLRAVRDSGALAAQVTGSGPTVFGVYADRAAAHQAAELLPRAVVTALRS